MTPELHSMPSFVYEQLDENESMIERPIEVVYWHGSIELIQGGTNILIQNDDIKKLFKAIIKNFETAQEKIRK